MKKKYWERYGNIREKWKREGRDGDGDIAQCGRQGHYTHNNDDDDDD
jgi:hypothetical protein